MKGCGGRSRRPATASSTGETVVAPSGTVPASRRYTSSGPPELIISDPSDSDHIEVTVEAALFEEVTPPPYPNAQNDAARLYKEIIQSHVRPLRTVSATSLEKKDFEHPEEDLEIPRSPSTEPPKGSD